MLSKGELITLQVRSTHIVDASSNKCVNSAGFSEVFELAEPSCRVDCLPACPTWCAPRRATLSVCVCVRGMHFWVQRFQILCSCPTRHACVWMSKRIRIRIRMHVWMQVSVSVIVSADCEWIAEMGILRLHCDLENLPIDFRFSVSVSVLVSLFRLLHSMAAQVVCPPWRMSNRLMPASDILLSNQWQRKQASSKRLQTNVPRPLICHAHLARKKTPWNANTHTHTVYVWARLLKARRCHLTIFMVLASAPAPAWAPAATPVTACCSVVRALFNKLLSRLHAGRVPAPTPTPAATATAATTRSYLAALSDL